MSKGDELGYFQFGGSSIIVVFKRGIIQSDDDLIGLSKQRVQVAVKVGMNLGRVSRKDGDDNKAYAEALKD